MSDRQIKIIALILVPLSIVGSGLYIYWLLFVPSQVKAVLSDQTELLVELVADPLSQARGLSGRDNLGEIDGMLFDYDGPEIRTFWMKDMKFEIDMIWLNDETIVGIDGSVPLLEDGKVARRTSPEPVNQVLEVKAGFSAAHNLTVGDVLDINYVK
ncbi:DUF192 domain-containing protein [Patescibacteria group bacterium]|nr:DUF192 domain-containing protein [Patescibacteria group bacterium]MBU1906789.1 DUF192 domain-containing protein [Patescibacteria group bacterium]